jgi:proton glutamate symport protein
MVPQRAKLSLALAAAGAVLLACGVALHAHAHLAAMVVRWAGVLALGVFAYRKRSLTAWIFVATVAGVEFGFDAPHVAVQTKVISDIFLRLIKTIVAPLIFSMLVVGIAGHGDLKSVGRMGVKSLVYFEVVTTLALGIGLAAINLSKAGVGMVIPTNEPVVAGVATIPHWDDFLLHMFPENIAKSVAEGQVLQVVVFALLFGTALSLVAENKRPPVLRLLESVAETMFKFTNIVMYLAPVAVGAAMAYTVGSMGLGVLVNLGKLVLTLYAALVVFAVGVMLPAALIFKVPVKRFLKAVAEPSTIAFATGASEAALPSAIERMEAMGVPKHIVAFVIPAGYSFNLAGSTLYLAVASVFIAQAAGMHMPLRVQLLMMLMLIITSKGVAAVPRSVLVVLMGTAVAFHLPAEGIALLMGADMVLDMARTVINVSGNCLASAIVATWEGELGEETLSPALREAGSR